MKAEDFLDAPNADDFLGPAPTAATANWSDRMPAGRGMSKRPKLQQSVLEGPAAAQAFAAAPDPTENARALFNAITSVPVGREGRELMSAGNSDLINSPMYRPGAAVLDRAVTGAPSAVQSATRRAQVDSRLAAQRAAQIEAARADSEGAFGNSPTGQALAAPGRRLLSGVTSVMGGVAAIPQLFGSDMGKETSDALSLMSKANMPADPGIADEVLSGIGQVGPMVGGGAVLRGALSRMFGERMATEVATGIMGAAGGALSGQQVMDDLEFRGDLSDGDKQTRALITSLVSAVSGKYADRFMLPGADKIASGPMQAGRRALFAEGGQEGLDQVVQNFATDKALSEGVGRAALVGGLVGGGTRVAGEINSAPYQLASAINADSQAFADRAAPQIVQQPVPQAFAPPAPPPVQPAPAHAPAPRALGYDPTVKSNPDVMVVDANGAARPMTADEFLAADDSRQQTAAKEQSDAEVGLTPDVRRAQEQRSDPAADRAPVETPELVKQLMARGWTPPRPASEGNNPNPDAEVVQGVGQDLESMYQSDVKDGIRTRLGLAQPTDTQEPAPAVRSYADSPLIRGIAQRGGIDPAQRSDSGVDRKQGTRTARVMPLPLNVGGKPLYRAGGLRGDMLVENLVQGGYLTQQQVEQADSGGVGGSEELAYDMIRRELANPGSVRPAAEFTDSAAGQQSRRVSDDLEQQAHAIGLDTRDLDDAQVSAALRRIDRRRGEARQRQTQFDAKREARAEREAIQSHEAFTAAQLDALDADWLAGSNVDLPTAMRALGFDETEIQNAAANAQDSRSDQAPPGDASGRAPPASAADEGSQGRPSQDQAEGLTSYTPEELRQRDEQVAERARAEARQQADDEAKAKREREQREIGDRARQDASANDYQLGQDANDSLSGQRGMFSRPEERGITQLAPASVRKYPAATDFDSIARTPLSNARSDGGNRLSLSEAGPTGNTADNIRTALRQRFGDVIEKLESRGILKLWDTVQAFNDGQNSERIDGAASGFYDGKTAHLFGDGINPGEEVGVFLHEVGEHATMQQMMGPRYDNLVRRAHDLVAQENQIALAAEARIPEDTALERRDSELLAYMIEEATTSAAQGSPSVRKWVADTLAAFKAWFATTKLQGLLERYGKGMEMAPADIAALAVRAVQWQAKNGQGAEAGARFSRPARGTSAAQAAAKVFGRPANTTNAPAPAPPGGPVQNNVSSAAAPWNVAEPGTWDNVVRTMQNNKVDLKRVRAAIEERFGRIPDATDAYLQEELFHKKAAYRVEKLNEDIIDPILGKIAVAGKNDGVTMDDVNNYLHARHAPERNAAMQAINPTMANNTALSGMSDADAATTLADFRTAGKDQALQSIVADIDQLLSDTRTGLVADGLEEAGTVQAWEQAYKHYVPLQRDIEGGPAKGTGFSIRGPEAKRATGSNKAVVNILANIVTQAETAAIRAEKAEVGRSLLDMARQYPNSDFWKVDVAPTRARVNPNTGLVERNAVDPMYQTADNVVMVKDYGGTHFIVFNKNNDRAIATAKAMKNLDIQQVPKLIQYVGKGTRFIASLLTQRNPEFWLTNFARDLQGSAIQMNGTDAEGLQAKVLATLPDAFAGIRNVARKTGRTTQWSRYAEEFHAAGGSTGYMQMFDNSDLRMKDLQRTVDQMGQGKADPRRLARQMLQFVDDYNDVIENGMRLAVFQAARDSGVSTDRAASIAKNVTVNFNRKGNATAFVNSLYMFFNAGVQGTARMAEALATSNKARVAVGTMAGLAFVMDIVNRAMAGDDEETKRNRYDLISEFEKSRNWIIMNPAKPGSYVKIPLPLGFHVFHNAGRLMSDAAFRKDPRNAAEYGWAFASTLMDAFNPLGNVASVGQLIAPTVADPIVQLAENKNFMGGPVFKSDEQGFGKTDPKPAYTRYFENTPDVWKGASRMLNDITGGDKDKRGKLNIEPDILRHIYTSITGGPGRALDRTVDTVQGSARGQEVAASRLPLIGRFYGTNDDRQRERAYYEDLKRAGKAKDDFDYFVKVGRRDLATQVLKDIGQGDEAKGRRVIALFDQAKKDGRSINKRLRELAQDNIPDDTQTEQIAALKKSRVRVHSRVLERTAFQDE